MVEKVQLQIILAMKWINWRFEKQRARTIKIAFRNVHTSEQIFPIPKFEFRLQICTHFLETKDVFLN